MSGFGIDDRSVGRAPRWEVAVVGGAPQNTKNLIILFI